MKYVIVVCIISLGLGVLIFGLAGNPGHRLVAFDPHYPAAFLLSVDNRVRALRSAVGELLSDLVHASTAGFRERIEREAQTPPPAP